MWCKTCRQDVPALSSADRQSLYCPRCGDAVCADLHEASDEAGAADATQAGRLPWHNGWELDEQLRHIERVLHVEKGTADRRETKRLDAAHSTGPGWHVPTVCHPADRRMPSGKRGGGSGVLMWLSLGLGTTSLICGGILLGWSLATGQIELWHVGLPLALAGQIVLLAGLVLQIDRLWHDNRTTIDRLDNVGQELHELQTSAELLTTAQGPASSVFYSHLANGAGPQLLLSDLKGQLDLLAARIAEERLADR